MDHPSRPEVPGFRRLGAVARRDGVARVEDAMGVEPAGLDARRRRPGGHTTTPRNSDGSMSTTTIFSISWPRRYP